MTEPTIRERIEKLKQDQVEHLFMTGEAYRTLVYAREIYDKVLLASHELGVSNTAIAKEIGKSETSVRLYIKRRLEGTGPR